MVPKIVADSTTATRYWGIRFMLRLFKFRVPGSEFAPDGGASNWLIAEELIDDGLTTEAKNE